MFTESKVSFDDEMLILVDENDNVTGYERKNNVHSGGGVLHRAFSIFLFTKCGRVLLQQRSAEKPLWPLYWANSVCSHPRKGESSDSAASRRLMEELSVDTPLTRLYEFTYSATFEDHGSEREFCKVYAGLVDIDYPIVANVNEVADWQWCTFAEVERLLATRAEEFAPWFMLEWEFLRSGDYSAIRNFLTSRNYGLKASGQN